MSERENNIYNRTGEKPFTIANSDLLLNKDLTTNDKMIYLYLKLYGGQNKLAFTGLERMSEEIKLSINTIRKSLSNLEYYKYIKITKEKQKHGYFLNNYHIFDPYNNNQDNFNYKDNGEKDKKKKDNEQPSDLENQLLKEFEEWWNLYDKKKDKKAAITKFKSARKEHSYEEIVKGTKEYLKTITNKQYQKHPKTFLHNESYLDDFSDDIKSSEVGEEDNGPSLLEIRKREMGIR